MCNYWNNHRRVVVVRLDTGRLCLAHRGELARALYQIWSESALTQHHLTVHNRLAALRNSKFKSARLDLRTYRRREWNRTVFDGITLNQFCSWQYAVTGAFLRWKLLVHNISIYCFTENSVLQWDTAVQNVPQVPMKHKRIQSNICKSKFFDMC